MKNDDQQNLEQFEINTTKEVSLWQWAARILPMIVLGIISICYVFDLRNMLDLVIEIAVIVFFIICVIWWFWAINKIAKTIRYMKESQKKFLEVLNEFRKLKKDIGSQPKK